MITKEIFGNYCDQYELYVVNFMYLLSSKYCKVQLIKRFGFTGIGSCIAHRPYLRSTSTTERGTARSAAARLNRVASKTGSHVTFFVSSSGIIMAVGPKPGSFGFKCHNLLTIRRDKDIKLTKWLMSVYVTTKRRNNNNWQEVYSKSHRVQCV